MLYNSYILGSLPAINEATFLKRRRENVGKNKNGEKGTRL